VGAALPERPLALAGGLLFLGFGVWTLLDRDDEDEQAELRGRTVLLGVTGAFLVAEFGDKAMLATATLASTNNAVASWAGASLGMTAASGLAIVHVPARSQDPTAHRPARRGRRFPAVRRSSPHRRVPRLSAPSLAFDSAVAAEGLAVQG
jgi:hypothetical protein